MEMGSSVLPVQDVNLYSETTSSSSKIIPKIEPKLEPLDDNSHLSTNPQPPSSSPFPCSSSEPNLCSEFSHISELFRNAFAYPDSCAIVPVNNVETQLSNLAIPAQGARRYRRRRSSDLVRVTDLKPGVRRYFRNLIRRTRMLYESLRVFSIAEDEKHRDTVPHQKRTRADLKAATLMKQRGLWLNCDKRVVGNIPGVSVGDVFFFRMELCVVGLHGQAQAGIDFVTAGQSSNGEPIATSIIVSGGYEDDEDAGDMIIYTGHGGQDKHNRQAEHQKLECGNLAMERSMHYGVEVRVIRGFKYAGSVSEKVYVYDGLYRIVDTWFDVGKSGFGVYKFKLVRIKNQVEMGSAVMKFAKSLRIRPLEVRPKGYVTLDLSRKKENMPVSLLNDIDDHPGPVYYEYLPTAVFPPYVYIYGNGMGCECVGACLGNCFCIQKNGGEFVYDMNGILVRGKPLIFECGINCHCPPTCRNRVSQKGIRHQLEVFRSRETGWGVRSLDLIQAGSFICEYAGVVLTREQAQIFTMNGDCLVHPSRFAERWAEWGDLSQIFSDYARPSHPSIPPLDFSMDVSRMRNVACYMSHSSSPNVFVQLVLYDHNNVSFPHLMVFAMENIPPMRELSLDYGVDDERTWEAFYM
ncbi:Histone-lysine N-methyltransferase family member SUVH9 [Abeliophyllum distichum]|uniref:Histone-lysine N-methyltransferase family member SUVH9 n=1 Tax=Abeliophyllum distichum TaxID=126358 RepID=A0ABD1T1A4_9LAMI